MQLKFIQGCVRVKDRKEMTFNSLESISNDYCSLQIATAQKGNFSQVDIEISVPHPMELSSFYLEYSFDTAQVKGVFANGFQSWTDSRVFTPDEKISKLHRIIRPMCQYYSDDRFYAYSGKKGQFHSWGYTYFKLTQPEIFFIGGVNEDDAYTYVEVDVNRGMLRIYKDVEGWCIEGKQLLASFHMGLERELKAFHHYFAALDRDYPTVEQAAGWTSWYHYYTNISEEIILKNARAVKDAGLPLTYFQIDDGFQEKTGDWLKVNNKFPNGMAKVADEIKALGFIPGLWLAPFLVSKKSEIAQKHPDWLLKDGAGKVIKMGYNPMWDGWFYALDFYHSEVRVYLKEVFNTVINDWHFDLVKLDFLFGAAPMPRNGKTRGKIMAEAMLFLGECVGDKLILGCGVPLIPAFGRVDYCRIGPDIHLKWDFAILKWLNNRERPSNFNAIGNTINRRQLSHQGFLNDPDVFILRKEHNKLTKGEKYALLLANVMFGDLIFTSDDVAMYDGEMMAHFKSIFPLQKPQNMKVETGQSFYRISFQVKERQYIAFFNLSDSLKRVKLPAGLYFDGTGGVLVEGNTMWEVPAHEASILYHVGLNPFAIAGTVGHIFPAAEIDNIYLVDEELRLDFSEGLICNPTVYIKIPNEYDISIVNGSRAEAIQKRDFKILKWVKR